MDFGFREIDIFCRVVELESFSRAAEAVHLVQASVSERVASLERKVGARLLDRLGRKVVPTAAGRLLYGLAVPLLEMKRTAELEMESFLGLDQGEVTIGGSTIPGEYILPEIIGRFREQYPHVSVQLSIGDSSTIETLVLDGKLEIGVIGSETSLPGLECCKLWEDELVLAIPANHPWHGREAVPLHELAKAPFILREKGSGTLKVLESYLRDSGDGGIESLQVSARFGSSTAVKEGIKSGLGLSILSRRAIGVELEYGILEALRVEGVSMHRCFYLIRNKARTASPSCRAMVAFLQSTACE